MVSGKFDIESAMTGLVSIPQGEHTITTECCYIFPESLGLTDSEKGIFNHDDVLPRLISCKKTM
ncbi:hypothetical protein DENSPDRAFT_844602 [Dentipellis sp. KUC8613]|nr:hypothetical protein DENSPDRAFT_844602 [Dentipellis sp. KUC8613]